MSTSIFGVWSTCRHGLQIRPILPNFGEMWRIRPPPISKKLALFIKKIDTVHKKPVLFIENSVQKSDLATSGFLHSIKFLNTACRCVTCLLLHSRHNYSPLFHLSMHDPTIPCILYMLPYLFPTYFSSSPIYDIDLPFPPRRNH
jgi:hypothetical protein